MKTKHIKSGSSQILKVVRLGSKECFLKITDTQGKTLLEVKCTKKNQIIDISHLKIGVYMVKILCDGQAAEPERILICG